MLPPGGTANFSAFSPNQWGANSLNEAPFGNVSNSACTGVDDRGDAQKIIYFSPLFHGFQLSASYTPNPDAERHGDGVGAHTGMPPQDVRHRRPDADSDASAYLTYSYQGRNWGLTWGGGASWEMGTDSTDVRRFRGSGFLPDRSHHRHRPVLDRRRVRILPRPRQLQIASVRFREDLDAWVAGGGIAYNYRAWTFGAQYSYREDTFRTLSTFGDTKTEQVQQRAVATVNYALGPGINLDGEVGYTWRDRDPDSLDETDDDYDGLELGIGTALSF